MPTRAPARALARVVANTNQVAASGYRVIMRSTKARMPPEASGRASRSPPATSSSEDSPEDSPLRGAASSSSELHVETVLPQTLRSSPVRPSGSAPARRSARTIHARPSHAAYVMSVCGPSGRPMSRDASHVRPRRASVAASMGSSTRSSESFTRPNSFGEFASTSSRKRVFSASVIERRVALRSRTKSSARRRILVRTRSRDVGMTPRSRRGRRG